MPNALKSFDNGGDPAAGRAAGVAVVRLAYGFACDVEHDDRRMRVDLPVEDGGGATGPHPEQLLRASLGASLVMGYRLWAARRGLPLDDIELRIACESAAPAPPDAVARWSAGWRRVVIDVTLTSSAQTPELEALVETVHRHCPMLALLSPAVERELRVRFATPEHERR